MNKDHLLQEAYNLINEMMRFLPPCHCSEAYRSRNLIDPGCIHCSTVEDDVYNGMVAWRDKMTRLYEKARLEGGKYA